MNNAGKKIYCIVPVLLAAFFASSPVLSETVSRPVSLNPLATCQAGPGMSGQQCAAADAGCRERFGAYSFFTGARAEGNFVCECREGYGWNGLKTSCIPAACPDDLAYYSQYRDETGWFLHGRCLAPETVCRLEFGDGASASPAGEVPGPRGGAIDCVCGDGYEWNAGQDACAEKTIVAGLELSPAELDYIETLERERAAVEAWDIALMERLAGRILIQVEDRGRAWYLDPVTRFRHYLAGPSKAWEVMRERGLGARHEFIARYRDGRFPLNVRGRILIDVDDLGKAYYISPVDGQGHYLGVPDQALRIMREVGLGISNKDLRKIPLTEIQK